MYVAKLNDRGKASYAYMFDEQLYNLDELFSKSYYMKKSSDKQSIVEYCHQWNAEHKEQIRANKAVYYLNVGMKGLLQAPALVVLYSCIIMGVILLFGSELFYEQIMLYGIAAFGSGIRSAVIVTYIVSAIAGLIISLSTYNNVFYKLIRSIFSVLCFVAISPVFFDKVFFSNSNDMISMTIIFVVGCFFARILIDRLLTGIIRKRTEKMIRRAHKADNQNTEPELQVSEQQEPEREESTVDFELQPIMARVRSGERIKQYRR